jgi:hypothetical protein
MLIDMQGDIRRGEVTQIRRIFVSGRLGEVIDELELLCSNAGELVVVR